MAMTRRRWLAHCSAALVLAQLAAPMPSCAAATRTVLVVGDSLSAEYGLARGSGWVALLEQRIAREQIAATVVNASISGDTTAGGLARLPPLLKSHPSIVVIALGGAAAAARAAAHGLLGLRLRERRRGGRAGQRPREQQRPEVQAKVQQPAASPPRSEKKMHV